MSKKEFISRSLGFVLLAFLLLVLWSDASGQATDKYVGACASQANCILEQNVSWANGNQIWRFTAWQPNESIRIWILNRNTSSAHNTQTVQVFLTDDSTATSLTTQADRWVQAGVTDNSTTGAQCANVAANNPAGAPGANGKATCYTTGMYAVQIAVRITGAAAAGGSPDTFDLGIVQQPSVYPGGPQPGGSDTSGEGTRFATTVNAADDGTSNNTQVKKLSCIPDPTSGLPVNFNCVPPFAIMGYSNQGAGGGSWERIRTIESILGSGLAAQYTGVLATIPSFTVDQNFQNSPRAGAAQSSTNATQSGTAGTTLPGMQITTGPAAWTAATQAATASQCTASVAAGGAGVRHCATGYSMCIVATAAQTQLFVNLRDGASGAGTVKWNSMVAGTIGNPSCINQEFSAGPICGTAATAMTVELSAATAGTDGCASSIKGYDVQ